MILIMAWFIISFVVAYGNAVLLQQHITETCTAKIVK